MNAPIYLDYDAWYDSPRGRWIGEVEFELLARQLATKAGASLLDVGCGSGWFTRRLAAAGLDLAAAPGRPKQGEPPRGAAQYA